jgi:hypothetical protein
MKWLRYSGITLGMTLNPYHWTFAAHYIKPTDMDPCQYGFYVSLGFVWLRVWIDNGDW